MNTFPHAGHVIAILLPSQSSPICLGPISRCGIDNCPCLSLRVIAALRAAARRVLVSAAFFPAILRLRVIAAFFAAALRFVGPVFLRQLHDFHLVL